MQCIQEEIMPSAPDDRLLGIGVFYDGGFFAEVSDHCRYHHPREARLSIDGIHQFIRHRVAQLEGVELARCQVVDAHYFRGRFSAAEAEERGKLMAERQFDDALMRAGVITHHLPRSRGGEKGIDVWFALEAFELAIHKRFSVVAMIACDGDYVPLVRKLHTLGTRVMLLGWEAEREMTDGDIRVTRTSQRLLEEVTYPLLMNEVIDDPAMADDPLIDGLFVPSPQARRAHQREADDGETRTGHVKFVRYEENWGFIEDSESIGHDWFFHRDGVLDSQFHFLEAGDSVEFQVGEGRKGPMAVAIARTDGNGSDNGGEPDSV
jgi:cold shock CspA family protein